MRRGHGLAGSFLGGLVAFGLRGLRLGEGETGAALEEPDRPLGALVGGDGGVDEALRHGLSAAARAAVGLPVGESDQQLTVFVGPFRVAGGDGEPVGAGTRVGAGLAPGEARVGYSQGARQPQLGAELRAVGDGLG